MSSSPGYLRQLWHNYLSLRLPWRRQFLVGADLAGNTFWEFRDAMNARRLRRMVKYKGGSRGVNYADVRISRASSPHTQLSPSLSVPWSASQSVGTTR